mmetsp:Transcript_26364/g.30383  ORF Transcript_26364/g.30383 Transcript_26364/m.30383 type:complete len:196 (+) Transcript_26364:597-1184(+)|eukprot:CAMPEP_0170798484 /NCGR_PEP_ID=MMETSP0733-20121128/26375_1 /TAXON_ID=186038 /ORGANISM="Fragilariopsis kerguelensis, Strain L26-C5" /LENGTH=195 /DNA_ID=CAMNT_0011149829 /DNA_START=491 /DNA_END=1078 /DNA_ORIENTATION=+
MRTHNRIKKVPDPLPDQLRECLVDDDNYSNSDIFRCGFCFKYYDSVTSWKKPMSNVYFIQCKRHRKSFMYWCKTHQVGFGSKRELVNHCNQNSTLQCGGLLGYSWSYHEHEQQDDNEDQKKGGTKEDEAYDNRINDHTFLSWTFQQDDTDDQIGSDFNFGGVGGDSGGGGGDGTPGISVEAGNYREGMSRKQEFR